MKILNIKHSGLMGDIIYAIPAMQELISMHGFDKVDLYIANNKSAGIDSQVKHIGGSLMFTQPMFDFITPLIHTQSLVNNTYFIKEEEIPADCVDFDIIRHGLINTGAGNIPGYYAKAFGLVIDLNKPWLEVDTTITTSPYEIIIGRSTRYINNSIDYNNLCKLEKRVGFIGTKTEHEIFSRQFEHLRSDHLAIENAFFAATYIKKANLYIGNQSFLFSIAESTKVNRLLESFEPVPNVVPSGGVCSQFITTKGLFMQINKVLRTNIDSNTSKQPEYHLNHPLLTKI